MGIIQKDLESFYKGLQRAQAILDKFSDEFTTKIESVSTKLDELTSLTAKLRIAEDSPIASLVNSEIGRWQQIIDVCRNEAKKQIDGREFQTKFEKVPLVIVFGIVKAGKSTLGNFVHGRAFRQTEFDNVYKNGKIPISRIIVQEKGREDASEKDAFDENSIESTCSAQYFTLPGLAWVDTPGIGAIEKKRVDIVPLAEIARKYVQYADLVVFLANSTNPGVQEDIAGYKDLYECGKKALVVITRSDTYESKVENRKVIKIQVPKNRERRQLQEKSLCDAMEKNGVPREFCDAVSISTQLAEKAVAANDDALWDGGNMGEFYRKIVSVIGDSQILELKKAAPRKLWDKTVSDIVGSESQISGLTGLLHELSKIQSVLKEKYDSLDPEGSIVGDIVEDTVNQIRPPLRRFVNDVVENASGDDIAIDLKSLQSKIQRELVGVLGIHVKKIVGEFRRDVLSQIYVDDISAKASRKTDVQKFTVDVPEIVERDPEGFVEKFRAFFGKKYHSVETHQEEHSFSIDLGIDPTSAKSKLIAELEKALERHIKGELARLRKLFFGTTLDKIKNLESEVSKLSKSLEKCRFNH